MVKRLQWWQRAAASVACLVIGCAAGCEALFDNEDVRLKLENGLFCNDDVLCLSGFCVDNVCCASACEGACMACSKAIKGTGIDGVCEPVDPNKVLEPGC